MQINLFLAVVAITLEPGFGMSMELSRAHQILYGNPEDPYANWFLGKNAF